MAEEPAQPTNSGQVVKPGLGIPKPLLMIALLAVAYGGSVLLL